jgi:hypothetical protein
VSDTASQTLPDEGDRNLNRLREKAAMADEATAALEAAQRENASLRSGIDLESPLGEFFLNSYRGDPSDVEGLKVEASRLGIPFVGQAQTQVVEETVPEEIIYPPTGTSERTALADGAPADTGEDKDPRQIANERFDQKVAEGAPRDSAAADHLNVLANAAMRGDPRVIVP